jgi:hypothetical protein
VDIDLEKLIPTPSPTSTEPWEVSLAELVRRTGEVGFDNDDVAWDKVVELRTHRLSDLLTGRALEHEVDRMRSMLPPIPGRKWVVTKVVNLTLDILLALTGDDAQKLAGIVDGADGPEGVDAEGAESDGDRVVAEIVYTGRFGRTKEVRGGLVAAAVLGAKREVSVCLEQAAGMRGIPVVASEDDEHFEAAWERSQAMRARIDSLRATARRLRGQQDDDPDADPDDAKPDEDPDDDVKSEVGAL